MEEIQCLVCNHAGYRKKLTAVDIKVSRRYFIIVECEKCGFIFLNPRPSFNEIKSFYGNDYYAYKDFKTSITPPKQGSNGLKYLEIGSGSGYDLIGKIKKGYATYGLDIDENAVRKGREKGLNLSCYDGRKIPFEDNFFDVISLNHVIEHAHFLVELLQEIHRTLKKNGKVHISCPNIESYEAIIYGNIWRHLDVPRHLYFFSPRILEKLLKKNNFEINSLTTYNTPVFDRNLTYIKSCYTMLKTKNFISPRKTIFGKIHVLSYILKNFLQYALFNHAGLKGQMINCKGSKK